jgi:hypothetical protein
MDEAIRNPVITTRRGTPAISAELAGEVFTRRVITVVLAAITALTFAFGFGNVWALGRSLGVPPHGTARQQGTARSRRGRTARGFGPASRRLNHRVQGRRPQPTRVRPGRPFSRGEARRTAGRCAEDRLGTSP